MILDYSEYIREPLITERPEARRFFAPSGRCRHCSRDIPKVAHAAEYQEDLLPDDRAELFLDATAWQCPSCGWWEVQILREAFLPDDDPPQRLRSVEEYRAVLRVYDASSTEVPLSTLRREIDRHPEFLNRVDPKKMEELVQAVFRDHYACDVIHVGRSHDQGIDLILVNATLPTLVQVKRRARADACEPVSTVREFLSAVLLDGGAGQRGAIFVTTANRFSPEANKVARRAITLDLVTSFELIAAQQFLSILKLARGKMIDPWQTVLKSAQ